MDDVFLLDFVTETKHLMTYCSKFICKLNSFLQAIVIFCVVVT